MQSEKKKDTKTNKKLYWILAFCAIVALWHYAQKPRHVPQELIGTWRSSDPRYTDRSLEIDGYTINFGTGNGTVAVGFVRKVDVVPDHNRMLYTISYVEEGKDEQCFLYYTSGEQKKIFFKNQPTVAWIRD
ncbi:MAG TPA: hypothetical protein VEX69_04745 [Candidatus Limnocylindria bacterium]|nr:hypothetical protein [Candidatus Limnocylindria bacterium]